MHRAGTESPDQQMKNPLSPIIREITGIFEGGKSKRGHQNAVSNLMFFRLKNQQKKQNRKEFHHLLNNWCQFQGSRQTVHPLHSREKGADIG